ncbi:multidrug effflux MFS transporter [Vibrio sp. RC27]
MKTVPFKLVLFLASVFALAPFATDSYLPGIPLMAKDLNVDSGPVALTVSIYVFAMAFGQLFGGPLCDRAGRRVTVILGLIMFAIGGFLIAGAGSLSSLYVGRVIQALGGGMAFVCVPAIIRDTATGKEAAKLFTLISLIMMVAPSIAPTVGTLILKLLSWHWVFILMSIFSIVVIFAGLLIVPNNYKYEKQDNPSIVRSFVEIFNTKEARKYVVIQAATFSILMIFLTNSSLIFIEQYELSEELFSALFLINTSGSIVVNRINSYLLSSHSPQKLLSLFIGMQVVGVLVVLISQLVVPDLWIITSIGFAIALSSLGGIMGNSNACFMAYFKKNAGTASAYIGASQSIISAVVAALSTLVLIQGLWILALLMLGISVVALVVSMKKEQQSNMSQSA